MVKARVFVGIVAAILAPQAARAEMGLDPCADILPAMTDGGARRALEPLDLVRLRDIGPLDPEQQDARLLTLSPDGRHVAFQLRRAEPRSNSYCVAMVVMALEPGAPPRIIDRGNELIRATIDFRGKAGFPTGVPLSVTPRWSPDGRAIYFLKRSGEITQVWRAFTDGSGSEALTSGAADVEDFRLSADGSAIIFLGRPGLAEARAAIEREGRRGFHYDDRYAPASSSRPYPPTPVERAILALDLASGATRPTNEEERRLMGAREDLREEVWTGSRGPHGRRAWIEGSPILPGSRRLSAEGDDGQTQACVAATCIGAYRPWWSPDGLAVRYFRREGWGRASTAIYEWRPGRSEPSRLYLTEDVLADCAPLEGALLCLREGSLQPRHIERLDLSTGRRTPVFEPNPEFARLALGQVQRLSITNSFNLPTVADLVLPIGYRSGRRYPLIVVQYDTRGFLRGGTGDDYPIQAFANRGYAVLSISRPASLSGDVTDPTAAERINLAGFADRRSTLSTVEIAVRQAIERGVADPARIGITGMSNGSTTATFALLHSDLFSAVAISHCCFDTTLPTRVGPAAARHFYGQGYPRMTDDDAAFWSQISLSRNARRIRTPILLQVSDDEYMSALESFTALREVGAPIDMFVFPGEHHVKWQPVHRLAIYERSLDWFDYWLRGIRSPAPERQAELRHWDTLRLAPPRPAAD